MKIAAIVLIGIMGLVPQVHAYCDAEKVEKAFGKTYKSTMKAIKTRDAPALLNVFNRDGVRFGAASEPVAYDVLQQQFSEQNKTYCDVFVCEERPGFISRVTGAGISTTKETHYWLGAAKGVVRISNGSVAGTLELQFSTTATCDWQLDALIFNE